MAGYNIVPNCILTAGGIVDHEEKNNNNKKTWGKKNKKKTFCIDFSSFVFVLLLFS